MTDDEILKIAERAWQDNMHDERAYTLAFARALLSASIADTAGAALYHPSLGGVANSVNAANVAAGIADTAGASEVRLSYKTLQRMYGDANILFGNQWCEKYRIIKQAAKEPGK